MSPCQAVIYEGSILLMPGWRVPEWRYHDPFRAELQNGREPLSPEKAVSAYKAMATVRAREYVDRVIAPRFPREAGELATIAADTIDALSSLPSGKRQRTLAQTIADRWLEQLPALEEHRVEIEIGLTNFVLRHVTRLGYLRKKDRQVSTKSLDGEKT